MRLVRRGALFAAVFAVVVYAADYLAARTYPLGSVAVEPYYAIHLKTKRTEFDFDSPVENETCVQSFAPHLGYRPCWYVKRHTNQRVDE